MGNKRKDVQLGFTEEPFPAHCHVCLIYDSQEQRQKIVSEYMAAGLRKGELVRYLTDTTATEQVHSWLLEMGVEIPAAEASGAFTIIRAEDGYCPGGRFEPREMIDKMVPRFEMAKKAGFSGTRSCGEMSWALRGIPGSNRLLEYEALLNSVTDPYPHTGMCQYDAHLFDGATLLKVLKVHPYMIAKGQIVRNPFYLRTEEFLERLDPEKQI
ncbi:MAG: MEDS domain-containing protein [Bacteroidales bacterium]|jgi:hypothetical protein